MCTAVHICDVTRDRSFFYFHGVSAFRIRSGVNKYALELTERIKEDFPNIASEQYRHFRRAA
jgi:hypothetical protein